MYVVNTGEASDSNIAGRISIKASDILPFQQPSVNAINESP
jgi:hypothetical protein